MKRRIEQINCLNPYALLDETKFIAAKEIMERFSQLLPCVLSLSNCVFYTNRSAGHDLGPQSTAMDQSS